MFVGPKSGLVQRARFSGVPEKGELTLDGNSHPEQFPPRAIPTRSIPTKYRADRSIHSEGARGFAYGYQTETTGFFWVFSPFEFEPSDDLRATLGAMGIEMVL